MANVITKSDERRAYEEQVLRSFGGSNSAVDREAAQVIAARSQEAIAELRRMEGKNR